MVRKDKKYSIVFDLYEELRAIPVAERKRLIENPEDTRLEDVDLMLYGREKTKDDPEILPEVDRLISIPPLSSRRLEKSMSWLQSEHQMSFVSRLPQSG